MQRYSYNILDNTALPHLSSFQWQLTKKSHKCKKPKRPEALHSIHSSELHLIKPCSVLAFWLLSFPVLSLYYRTRWSHGCIVASSLCRACVHANMRTTRLNIDLTQLSFYACGIHSEDRCQDEEVAPSNNKPKNALFSLQNDQTQLTWEIVYQ